MPQVKKQPIKAAEKQTQRKLLLEKLKKTKNFSIKTKINQAKI